MCRLCRGNIQFVWHVTCTSDSISVRSLGMINEHLVHPSCFTESAAEPQRAPATHVLRLDRGRRGGHLHGSVPRGEGACHGIKPRASNHLAARACMPSQPQHNATLAELSHSIRPLACNIVGDMRKELQGSPGPVRVPPLRGTQRRQGRPTGSGVGAEPL
eukprot:6715546-Pyramimonas_sp.AAC.1